MKYFTTLAASAYEPTPIAAPLILFGLLAIGLVFIIFWIWMLVDCIKNEPSEGNDKVVWVVVIALLGWLGALIYLIVRRPVRKREHGR